MYRSKQTSPLNRNAFTLVEVLVSIALVLIIILGVNQVFALTSRAVGAGNAMSESVRNFRNAQNVMSEDLRNADIDRAPFFIIRSMAVSAFRNQEDLLTDSDFSAASTDINQIDAAIRSVDLDGNGMEEPGERLNRAVLSKRTHRADFLAFFTRSTGQRQTGNKGSFVSKLSSDEQYVIYTHLRQLSDPGNEINFTITSSATNDRDPGAIQWTPNLNFSVITPSVQAPKDNPFNYYASQWVLGRKAMILREPNSSRIMYDAHGNAIWYYGRAGHPNSNSNPTSRAPFSANSSAVNSAGTTVTSEQVQNSYYDVAGVKMEEFRTRYMPQILTNNPDTWCDPLIYRPLGFPTPSRPLTSNGAARTVPCFMENASQFLVEYAGDFVYQDPNSGEITGFAGEAGKPIGEQTDGQIDFCINPVTGGRQVRWYGFPRDTNVDGQILTSTSAATMARRVDTLPARDVVRSYSPNFPGFTFEKDLTRKFLPTTPNDYMKFDLPVRGTNGPFSYVCCWSPETSGLPRPKLLRIVMATDDPTGRLSNEQLYEYVVELP